MHGKTPKFASTILTALLFTQGLLGLAGVTLVVLKHTTPSQPVLVADAASVDAQLR
jgi:hypothetical protein